MRVRPVQELVDQEKNRRLSARLLDDRAKPEDLGVEPLLALLKRIDHPDGGANYER